MKRLSDIREQSRKILDEDKKEENKLRSLVNAGMLEENKLPVLKRAISNGNRVLTPAEHNAVMGLLESLMSEAVADLNEELKPATTKMSDMPSILVLKRKAIRVYPGGQNVGLYYSQQLDKYVAVPFTPGASNKADKKSVVTMNEEEQLDEISNQLRDATFAKRVRATRQAKKDSPEQINNLSKALKTATRTVTKGGVAAYANMQKFADKYDSAMDDTQASLKKTFTKKKAKSINPLQRRKPMVKPDEQTEKTKAEKPPKKSKEAIEAHNDIMGGSVGSDLVNGLASNKSRLVGDVIGRAAYRAMHEGVTTSFLRKAKANILKNKNKSASAKSLSPDEIKKKRLEKIDAMRDKQKEDAAKKGTSTSTSSSELDLPEPFKTRISPTSASGTRRSLEVRSSSALQRYRDRQQTIANMNYNRVREDVEIDLSGNKFLLNKSVANKVQNVYESLNKTNKKKMLRMMNESAESLNKVISFALGQ